MFPYEVAKSKTGLYLESSDGNKNQWAMFMSHLVAPRSFQRSSSDHHTQKHLL